MSAMVRSRSRWQSVNFPSAACSLFISGSVHTPLTSIQHVPPAADGASKSRNAWIRFDPAWKPTRRKSGFSTASLTAKSMHRPLV
ncbi:hypothetical protein D3C71_2080780 [compost metagenome]